MESERDFESLIEQHDRMIWQQVNKYHIPGITEMEDLYQMGLLGLWKAQSKFDPSKQVKFTTYAYHNIRGWVRRGLTKQLETGVSRGDLEKIKYFKNNPDKKISHKDLNLLLYAEGVLSLDVKISSNDTENIELKDKLVSKENVMEVVLNKASKEERLSKLDKLEKKIIRMKYYEGYKNKEIQEILKISRTHLWNKENTAKLKIKKYST